MAKLNTSYPTIVFDKSLVDPTIIESLSESKGEKRHTTYHDYSEPMDSTKQSVVVQCFRFIKRTRILSR